MLEVEELKKVIGETSLSDVRIEELRNSLYQLTEKLIDAFMCDKMGMRVDHSLADDFTFEDNYGKNFDLKKVKKG